MAKKYEQLLLKNQLCFPLYACSRKIVNAYQPHLKPLGLTYTQYIVFMALWEHKEMTVGQLGETLMLDAGTLTPLLKKLEKDGYVTRARSKEDERVTIIKLTDKGEDLKEQCKDIPSKVAPTLGALDGDEIAQLYALLYKVINS